MSIAGDDRYWARNIPIGSFNEKAGNNDQSADRYFRERIDWTLGILHQYALALKQVRESGVADTDRFSSGMQRSESFSFLVIKMKFNKLTSILLFRAFRG